MRELLCAVVLTGCFTSSQPRRQPDQALVLGPPPAQTDPPREPGVEPPVVIARSRDRIVVAGCNTGCTNCGLGGYKTYVIGTLARTGRKVFPAPDPPSPGYACATEVAIGERVTLRAHSPEGLVIESWKPFFDTDYCPCTGTAAATCHVQVTAEIAARYERVYCGAVWKHAGAELAR